MLCLWEKNVNIGAVGSKNLLLFFINLSHVLALLSIDMASGDP